MGIARYTRSLQLDVSFADTGRRVVDVFPSSTGGVGLWSPAHAVAITGSNIIAIVPGDAVPGTDQSVTYLRFNDVGTRTGTRSVSFGTFFSSTTDWRAAGDDLSRVFASGIVMVDGHLAFATIKINSDTLALDRGFGGTGIVMTAVSGKDIRLNDVAVQPLSSRPYVVGETW
jgi:hypothetical protein